MPNPAASSSPTSKLLHRLGCLFIGTPQSLSMPRDFYREKGDRDMPTAKEIMEHKVQRNQIAVDAYRRALTPRVGLLTCFAAFGICLAGYVTLGVGSAIHRGWTKHQQTVSACANYDKDNLLNPDNCK